MALSVGPEGLPWPQGDPGGLRAAAGRAGALVGQIEMGASGFPSISGPVLWSGFAHDQFIGSVSNHAAAATTAVQDFQQVQQGLQWLAGVLEQAQHEVLDAARRLHAARAEEQAAVNQAIAARSAADQARATATAWMWPGPNPYEAAAQSAAATASGLEARAVTAVDNSVSVQAWAQQVAQRAVDRARQADQRLAAEMEQLGLFSSAATSSARAIPYAPTGDGLATLSQLIFGPAAASPATFAAWLTAPPPLPKPAPPKSHGGGGGWLGIAGMIGTGVLAFGADAFAAAQFGLDPLADGAAGAADTLAVGTTEEVLAGGGAAAADSAAAASAVPIMTATEADGATIALTPEEQAAAQAWRGELPTKPTPTNTPADVYEVTHTGPANFQMQGAGENPIWGDGFRPTDAHALEAKFVGSPSSSPFIEGSTTFDPVRTSVMNKVTSEIIRYGAVIRDPANPVQALEVITNDQNAAQTFARLMSEYGVSGRVVVRP